MKQFFKIQRNWPEEYCSVTISAKSPEAPHHTGVFEKACGRDFLDCYEIKAFRNGLLADVLPNNNGWLLVSPRCRSAIESVGAKISAHFVGLGDWVKPHCPQNISQYALVSNEAVFDCLDLTSPELHWLDASQQFLRKFMKLILVADRIPEGAAFFGIARAPVLHVVSAEVRDALVAANISGLNFKPCEFRTG